MNGVVQFAFRSPLNEFLICDDVWGRGIVYEHRILQGRDVSLYPYLAVASMNSRLPVGIDSAIEGLVAKVWKVVDQHFLGVHIDVIGQMGQLLVMYAASQHAFVAIDVVDRAVDELNLVRYHAQRVVSQFVGAT